MLSCVMLLIPLEIGGGLIKNEEEPRNIPTRNTHAVNAALRN